MNLVVFCGKGTCGDLWNTHQQRGETLDLRRWTPLNSFPTPAYGDLMECPGCHGHINFRVHPDFEDGITFALETLVV